MSNVDYIAAMRAKTLLRDAEREIKSLSNFNTYKKTILDDIKNVETKVDEIIDFEKEKRYEH